MLKKEKYDVLIDCELLDCEVLETPKEVKYFENVDNILLLTNKTALFAMENKADELGYSATIIDSKIQGEARDIGKRLASEGRTGACLLYGGETTVTVSGDGVGGRNQELVLGSLPYIKEGEIVVAAASDGWDNSPSAGAIGDVKLFEKSREMGLSVDRFLKSNNSYEFFRKIHGNLDVGRTGSNVSDLYFVLMRS